MPSALSSTPYPILRLMSPPFIIVLVIGAFAGMTAALPPPGRFDKSPVAADAGSSFDDVITLANNLCNSESANDLCRLTVLLKNMAPQDIFSLHERCSVESEGVVDTTRLAIRRLSAFQLITPSSLDVLASVLRFQQKNALEQFWETIIGLCSIDGDHLVMRLPQPLSIDGSIAHDFIHIEKVVFRIACGIGFGNIDVFLSRWVDRIVKEHQLGAGSQGCSEMMAILAKYAIWSWRRDPKLQLLLPKDKVLLDHFASQLIPRSSEWWTGLRFPGFLRDVPLSSLDISIVMLNGNTKTMLKIDAERRSSQLEPDSTAVVVAIMAILRECDEQRFTHLPWQRQMLIFLTLVTNALQLQLDGLDQIMKRFIIPLLPELPSAVDLFVVSDHDLAGDRAALRAVLVALFRRLNMDVFNSVLLDCLVRCARLHPFFQVTIMEVLDRQDTDCGDPDAIVFVKSLSDGQAIAAVPTRNMFLEDTDRAMQKKTQWPLCTDHPFYESMVTSPTFNHDDSSCVPDY